MALAPFAKATPPAIQRHQKGDRAPVGRRFTSGAPIGSVVTGVNASGNRLGITLIVGSTNVRVVGNTANNNAFGIIVQRDSTGNILAGNKATGNGGADLSDGNSSCVNTWRGNRLATDFEGDGPGQGCVR